MRKYSERKMKKEERMSGEQKRMTERERERERMMVGKQRQSESQRARERKSEKGDKLECEKMK